MKYGLHEPLNPLTQPTLEVGAVQGPVSGNGFSVVPKIDAPLGSALSTSPMWSGEPERHAMSKRNPAPTSGLTTPSHVLPSKIAIPAPWETPPEQPVRTVTVDVTPPWM
jgi:hypothetical protein